jgi:hypothetical protein
LWKAKQEILKPLQREYDKDQSEGDSEQL